MKRKYAIYLEPRALKHKETLRPLSFYQANVGYLMPKKQQNEPAPLTGTTRWCCSHTWTTSSTNSQNPAVTHSSSPQPSPCWAGDGVPWKGPHR